MVARLFPEIACKYTISPRESSFQCVFIIHLNVFIKHLSLVNFFSLFKLQCFVTSLRFIRNVTLMYGVVVNTLASAYSGAYQQEVYTVVYVKWQAYVCITGQATWINKQLTFPQS